jgi:hypothetical protein
MEWRAQGEEVGPLTQESGVPREALLPAQRDWQTILRACMAMACELGRMSGKRLYDHLAEKEVNFATWPGFAAEVDRCGAITIPNINNANSSLINVTLLKHNTKIVIQVSTTAQQHGLDQATRCVLGGKVINGRGKKSQRRTSIFIPASAAECHQSQQQVPATQHVGLSFFRRPMREAPATPWDGLECAMTVFMSMPMISLCMRLFYGGVALGTAAQAVALAVVVMPR